MLSFGQCAVGTAIGLGFTSAILVELGHHGLLILAMAAGSVAIGLVAARLLQRWGEVSTTTAFFAGLPGSASEMVALAQRMGGAADRVAAAHAMRVMLVVSVVPFLVYGGQQHAPPVRGLGAAVNWTHLPFLLMAALAGAWIFIKLELANAWVLGPVLSVGMLTVFGVQLSALPTWLINGGQLALGSSMGCRFSPSFFRAAPRFLAVSSLSTGMVLLLGAVLSALLGQLMQLPMPALFLASAPGGMAEMSITARELGLIVPLVTATHVLRMTLVTFLAPWLCRRYLAWLARKK